MIVVLGEDEVAWLEGDVAIALAVLERRPREDVAHTLAVSIQRRVYRP